MILSPSTIKGTDRSLPIRAIAAGLAIVAVLVTLDQVMKAITVEWLGPAASQHRWELAGKYLAFEYVENEGAAFGILAGRTALLTALAIGVAIWFVVAMRRDLTQSRAMQVAVLLILAGAIGNLIDRVRLGYVVDYVAIGIWPKFNVADTCISLALVVLAWTIFLRPQPSDETHPYEQKESNVE